MPSDGYRQIAKDYIKNYRPQVQAEVAYFRDASRVTDAVDAAALCQRPDGKRNSHQRASRLVLEESRRRLREALPALRAASSFAELHDTVGSVIGDIHSIGKLTIYDTAVRIGWRLNIHPAEVYLHTGTLVGARALGLKGSRKTVRVEELPAGLQILAPGEIEDVLCIYKYEIACVQAGMSPSLGSSTRCQPQPRRPTC